MRKSGLALLLVGVGVLSGCMQATLSPTSDATLTPRDRQLLAHPPYAQASIPEQYQRHVVAYSRKAVGQQGYGHISPLGAYDAQSDSFLVLDVNAARYGWVWMPTSTLTKGMRTLYMVENLGYILVEAH